MKVPDSQRPIYVLGGQTLAGRTKNYDVRAIGSARGVMKSFGSGDLLHLSSLLIRQMRQVVAGQRPPCPPVLIRVLDVKLSACSLFPNSGRRRKPVRSFFSEGS